MDDKKKIRFLEGQIQILQNALNERNKVREAFCERIPWKKMEEGFIYPPDTLHTFVDPRDYSLILIRPKPETVKGKETKQEG